MKKLLNSDSENDPILTTRAVANLLGVSVSTAQLWIESGTVASWKTPGGHRRVRLSAVNRLLDQKEASGSSIDAELVDPPDLEIEYSPLPDPDYPVPPNEAERLRALAATKLIGSPPEHAFDRLTWLATQITNAPMALVSLLTAKRQWFKSRIGLAASETPREWAFCSHAILGDAPLIVEDALEDKRFQNNPLVTGEPHIRFYAGFPLAGKNNVRLGTLCVLDRQPRQLSEEQIRALHELTCLAHEEIIRRN